MTNEATNGSKPKGATPGEDLTGLIQKRLCDRASRNAAELEAISLAYKKYIYRAKKKKRGTRWLTDEFIRKVHSDMFGAIWNWAGQYRTINLNIGVEPHQIQEQIGQLCGDFSYWDSHGSMPLLEIGARLQNRLTRIHPFQNGNGRHARLITDIFFYSCDQALPKWPQTQLMSEGNEIREKYIAAMKKADQEDYEALMNLIGSWQA